MDNNKIQLDNSVRKIKVLDKDDKIFLYKWFNFYYPNIKFNTLQKLLRKGSIRIDGKRVKSTDRVKSKQIIRVPFIKINQCNYLTKKQNIKLSQNDILYIQNMIIYIDNEIIILNKPSGIAVQGGTNIKRHIDGMLEALRFGFPEKPKLVHRIDKDASGLLVIARTLLSVQKITKQFKDKIVEKYYWAVISGIPKSHRGVINTPLIKKNENGYEKVLIGHNEKNSKSAVTLFYTVMNISRIISFIVLKPITGRTHQLRVHMAEIGNFIVGDSKYGKFKEYFDKKIPHKLHLHARHIKFLHPLNNKVFQITAPIIGHIKDTFHKFNFDEKKGDLFIKKF